MWTVVEKPERTPAARCIVDNLSHHSTAVVEEQLVAYAYLARRLHQNVPQPHLLVELAQQEHLYLGICLLLRTVQARRENLCIIEDESVVLVEIVEHVAEVEILPFYRLSVRILPEHVDGLRLAMDNHQPAFVTSCHTERLCLSFRVCKLAHGTVRIKCDLFFRQFEFKL